jgi:MFS transporter, OFA family, oxalate/formate antiporter
VSQARRSLLIAALTLSISNGVVMAFAVLYLPLVAEFHASRAEVAAVQSAVLLLGGFGGPLVGWAFDRLGPRRLFQSAAVLGAFALSVGSRAQSLPTLVVTYGILGGLALCALGSQTNMLMAALWYPAARGRAIAVADLGTGFGAFCFIPLGQALVTTIGWRGTLLVWAALLLAVVVPLNAFQRLPARIAPAEPAAAPGDTVSAAAPEVTWSVSSALRAPAFWWLALMQFCGSCAFPVMNTHMVAYAIGQGIAPEQAATALGSVSLVSLAGRLSTGWLSDRIGRALTLTVAYGSAAIGIACLAALAVTGQAFWLLVYVAFYGMAQGSTGIIGSARSADVFAGSSFGAIYGFMALAVGPGQALGAWAGGKIFDVSGSYLPAFGFAAAALAVGVVAIWRVRERRPAARYAVT